MWTVRPKLTGRMQAGIGLVAAFLVIRGVADVGHPRSAMVDLISFGPLVVAALVVLAVALRNLRLIVDHDTVTQVTFFGRARTWPRSAVSRLDRFSTRYRNSVRYVVFAGADERALFTLSSAIWDVVEGMFSLNRRIPGVTTWRSWAGEGLVVAAIVVLVTIATLNYGPSSGA